MSKATRRRRRRMVQSEGASLGRSLVRGALRVTIDISYAVRWTIWRRVWIIGVPRTKNWSWRCYARLSSQWTWKGKGMSGETFGESKRAGCWQQRESRHRNLTGDSITVFGIEPKHHHQGTWGPSQEDVGLLLEYRWLWNTT